MCCNQSLKAGELLVSLNQLMTTRNDPTDLIQSDIDSNEAEYRRLSRRIDVVATGETRLEQGRKVVSEFGLPKESPTA